METAYGLGQNSALRWKDLALDELLPTDEEKELQIKAEQARKMANGVQANNTAAQQQVPRNEAGQQEEGVEEEEEDEEEEWEEEPSNAISDYASPD